MSKTTPKFRPFIGRCFELKSFTDLKKFPPAILVMDESRTQVMFLDIDGNATWLHKWNLRDEPLESRVFSTPDTLSDVMVLLEELRERAVDAMATSSTEAKKIKKLNVRCINAIQELRDLGTRMHGVRFAPPEESEPEESEPEESID